MAAVGHMRAGKNARVQVAGTNLRRSNWRYTYRADDLDTSNFEGNGWEQGTIGLLLIEWSLSGDWDAQNPDFADPPGLFPRDNLGDVKFYSNVSDAGITDVPANRVLSAENGAEVRGKVTFSASGKSQGSGATLNTTVA